MISRIVYSASAGDVRHVLVDGRIVVESGRLGTAQYADITREANRCARQVRQAAGL